MSHYVAIIEDAGPDKAVGVWFPDLPGCFSAGDTLDEAIQKCAGSDCSLCRGAGSRRASNSADRGRFGPEE